jgi:hypothetical protein
MAMSKALDPLVGHLPCLSLLMKWEDHVYQKINQQNKGQQWP